MTDNREPRSAIFARNVRELRKERGWSQAELGWNLALAGGGLGQARISEIEQTGSVSIDQADVFAKAFGVPLEALLYEEPTAAKEIPLGRLMKIAADLDELGEEIRCLIDTQIAD